MAGLESFALFFVGVGGLLSALWLCSSDLAASFPQIPLDGMVGVATAL